MSHSETINQCFPVISDGKTFYSTDRPSGIGNWQTDVEIPTLDWWCGAEEKVGDVRDWLNQCRIAAIPFNYLVGIVASLATCIFVVKRDFVLDIKISAYHIINESNTIRDVSKYLVK